MDEKGEAWTNIAALFRVRTCQGTLKRFQELDTWELLNLKPKTILDIPERLHDEFDVTPDWLEKELKLYNVQSIGKDALEYHFGLIEKPGQYLVTSTRHYSWPKSSGEYCMSCLRPARLTMNASHPGHRLGKRSQRGR